MTKIASKSARLGLWTTTSLVIGAMMGAGIFALPSSLASFGSISILAWIVTALGSIFLALTFIDLNKMIPQTGGAFLYAQKAYGDFMGFSIAASYWFAWCVACAGGIVAVTGFLAPFWPALNEHSASFNPHTVFLVNLAGVWLTVLINIFGIKLVGRVQLLTTLLKLVPLLLIIGVGIFHIHTSNLTGYFNISHHSNGAALAGAATLTLWAFTGLEAAVIPSDDIANQRTIARATIIGMLIASLIYILVTVVLLGIFPATEVKNSSSPFNDVATLLFGSSASYWIAACAIITIIGSVNGGILILIQDSMAAAGQKLLPKLFAEKNKKLNTPVKNILLSAVLISLVLLLTINGSLAKQFNFLILLSTLSLLIPYFVSATAALVLLMQNTEQFNRSKFIKSLTIAILSSAYAFWTLIGVGPEVMFYGCLFFFAIFWLHFIYKLYQWKWAAKPVELKEC